jgi:hypothetical protein
MKIMPPRLNSSIGVPSIPNHSRSRLLMRPLFGPRKKNPADALHDHWRRQRQECAHEHDLAERNIGARYQPGRRRAEQNGEKRCADGERNGDTPQVHPPISATRA